MISGRPQIAAAAKGGQKNSTRGYKLRFYGILVFKFTGCFKINGIQYNIPKIDIQKQSLQNLETLCMYFHPNCNFALQNCQKIVIYTLQNWLQSISEKY